MTSSDQSSSHRSRFRGQDGVTDEERNAAPSSSPSLTRLETVSREQLPEQVPLFQTDAEGHLTSFSEIPSLSAESSLSLARTWYQRDLERARRPQNTIKSYTYDLMVLEQLIGSKQLHEIGARDIARYLGDASNKATRKRRLTSVRRFFRFLIEERVLRADPTEGYFPHHIGLRLPVPLFASEQTQLLEAAAEDEAWSETAIRLMLTLGLTRSELLALRRDHIDRTNETAPVVYVFYRDTTKRSKERSLVADAAFGEAYDAFLEATQPEELLFPVGPPAVNGMVDRVRRAAGLTKLVTPQTLRHTFAVEQAKTGADASRLLQLLGLSDDPRNRESVDRYLRLAHAVNESE
jgi:integrase/recombinase XerD